MDEVVHSLQVIYVIKNVHPTLSLDRKIDACVCDYKLGWEFVQCTFHFESPLVTIIIVNVTPQWVNVVSVFDSCKLIRGKHGPTRVGYSGSSKV